MEPARHQQRGAASGRPVCYARGPAGSPMAEWHWQERLELARPERLELPTPRFVVWCSIQLSYGYNLLENGRIVRTMTNDEVVREEDQLLAHLGV